MATVLIADDNHWTRSSVRDALEALGMTVLERVDGAEAIDAVREHDPDAAVFDLVMPVCDGIEALRRIRREGRELPVLAYSTGDCAYPDFALKLGADYVADIRNGGSAVAAQVRKVVN